MAFSNGPTSVTNGLVLSLDAADKNSYPGSGTTWRDMSGRGNNSSLTNGPTFSNDNGGSIVFDGTDDIVLAPPVNTLGALPNHVWEIWIKSPGLGTGMSLGGLICPDYGMVSYITGDGNISYVLYSSDTSSYILSIGTSGVNCFDNKWHHIICTRQNNGTGKIYVDGQLKVESGNTGNWSGITVWSSMNTSIGRNPNDAFYYLKGNIAIAKIYNISFSTEQVLQNYNAQKSRFGL